MVMAERNRGRSARLASVKKACTPGLARRPFRASLMTLVSTRNIRFSARILVSFEVGVLSDIGHGGQQISQVAARWVQQRRRQDGAVLGFRAAAMGSGALPERTHHGVIDTTHQQIGHLHRFGWYQRQRRG
jgi:hypothetical protein